MNIHIETPYTKLNTDVLGEHEETNEPGIYNHPRLYGHPWITVDSAEAPFVSPYIYISVSPCNAVTPPGGRIRGAQTFRLFTNTSWPMTLITESSLGGAVLPSATLNNIITVAAYINFVSHAGGRHVTSWIDIQ